MKYFQVILLIASAVTSVVAEQCDSSRRFCKVNGLWHVDKVNEFLPKIAEKAGLGGNNKVEDIWNKFQSRGTRDGWVETHTFVVVFMNSKNGDTPKPCITKFIVYCREGYCGLQRLIQKPLCTSTLEGLGDDIRLLTRDTE